MAWRCVVNLGDKRSAASRGRATPQTTKKINLAIDSFLTKTQLLKWLIRFVQTYFQNPLWFRIWTFYVFSVAKVKALLLWQKRTLISYVSFKVQIESARNSYETSNYFFSYAPATGWCQGISNFNFHNLWLKVKIEWFYNF